MSKRIEPFRALLYNQERVANLREVVAPPYDLIDADRQDELYHRSPYNIVRLELGRESDRYAASAATLAKWRADDILRVAPRPAIYLYTQLFEVGGRTAPARWIRRARAARKFQPAGGSFRMRKLFRPPRPIASSC